MSLNRNESCPHSNICKQVKATRNDARCSFLSSSHLKHVTTKQVTTDYHWLSHLHKCTLSKGHPNEFVSESKGGFTCRVAISTPFIHTTRHVLSSRLFDNKDCPTSPTRIGPKSGYEKTLRPLHDVQERSNAWIMIVAAAQRLIPQRRNDEGSRSGMFPQVRMSCLTGKVGTWNPQTVVVVF